MFLIHRVDRESAESQEYLGTKYKFWYPREGKRLLFKADERGTGEDWAEKIACHLCELLGLPHVYYELAELFESGRPTMPGVICENFAPQPPSLVLGNQLLFDRDPAYPADQDRKYKVPQHTVDAVAKAVRTLAMPAPIWIENLPNGLESALDVFVGYIMLDALIANQDRHHENWGALLDEKLCLAPTFDHGASLARNISDDERQERLTTKDANRTINFFSKKAKSAFYKETTDLKTLGTLEAFLGFAELAHPAACIWLARLDTVSSEVFECILGEIPERRMSNIAKEFTLQLLKENQQRLRESIER